MLKFADLPKAGDKERREVENGVIDHVSLGFEDHGFLTASIGLRLHGCHVGFGGYVLGKSDGGSVKGDRDYCSEFVAAILTVAGVEFWEKVGGRNIRVIHSGLGGTVIAVGHIVEDRWFCPQVEWEKSRHPCRNGCLLTRT